MRRNIWAPRSTKGLPRPEMTRGITSGPSQPKTIPKAIIGKRFIMLCSLVKPREVGTDADEISRNQLSAWSPLRLGSPNLLRRLRLSRRVTTR